MHPLKSILCAVALAGAAVAQGGQGDAPAQSFAERPVVLAVKLEDHAITPITADFLDRALREAEDRGAECLVIELDTPGGLLTSTRQIVKTLLASTTPVVVYVSPSGGRAASAGVFITMASHVAAMTPGTTIGAAHPVQLGGGSPLSPQPDNGGQEPSGGAQEEDEQEDTEDSGRAPMEEKIINDTVAWARALAKRRGRNVEWIAEAVEQSVVATAAEAVENNVVDLLADDMDDLLEQLDGREVTLPTGNRTLRTANADVQQLSMWWGERLLSLVAQPNVAFLLMMFGFYGILFELYNPGWGVSGTLGVICILLALFGLAVLPVNYLGLALIAVALGLFVAEAFVASYGALAVGGTICLILAGVMLIDSPGDFARVSLHILVPIAAATGLITFLLVTGIIRSQRARTRTGGEGMIGREARVESGFEPDAGQYRGMVLVHGELWRAVSSQPLKPGQTCKVEDRDGLTLTVSSE